MEIQNTVSNAILYKNEDTSDVKFVLVDKNELSVRLPAHRAILSSRSKVFIVCSMASSWKTAASWSPIYRPKVSLNFYSSSTSRRSFSQLPHLSTSKLVKVNTDTIFIIAPFETKQKHRISDSYQLMAQRPSYIRTKNRQPTSRGSSCSAPWLTWSDTCLGTLYTALVIIIDGRTQHASHFNKTPHIPLFYINL